MKRGSVFIFTGIQMAVQKVCVRCKRESRVSCRCSKMARFVFCDGVAGGSV